MTKLAELRYDIYLDCLDSVNSIITRIYFIEYTSLILSGAYIQGKNWNPAVNTLPSKQYWGLVKA